MSWHRPSGSALQDYGGTRWWRCGWIVSSWVCRLFPWDFCSPRGFLDPGCARSLVEWMLVDGVPCGQSVPRIHMHGRDRCRHREKDQSGHSQKLRRPSSHLHVLAVVLLDAVEQHHIHCHCTPTIDTRSAHARRPIEICSRPAGIVARRIVPPIADISGGGGIIVHIAVGSNR